MKKKTIDIVEISIITIIVIILIVISLFALKSSKARANDARALADIKQIQSVLALYRFDLDVFPSSESFVAGEPLVAGEKIYLETIPKPPNAKNSCLGSNVYTYTPHISSEGLASYTLEYCLDSETAGISRGINTASPAGVK